MVEGGWQQHPASLLKALHPSQCAAVCSSSTTNRRGGCLTFPVCRDATSAYFLPLVISYLFSSSLIPLSFWPPHLLASHLPSLFGSSFCFSVTPLRRETIACLKKKKYSMLLPWQLHLGAEPVVFHRHACSLSRSPSTCLV